MRRVLMTAAAAAVVVAACGGSGDSTPTTQTPASQVATGDPVHGEELYGGTCIACHGPGGVGVEGLGKPWVASDFINTHTDQELVDFLKVGRPVDDPANTTGIAMMPRGGNPSLTDDDLLDLVAYMRTLNP